MVATDRIDAAGALVKIFRARYPERGFSFSSEKLKFDHTEEGGLRIVAKSAIRKDETLMVIPSAECLGIGEFSRSSSCKAPRTLARNITNHSKRYQQVQRYLGTEEALLAISIMKVLAKKCQQVAPESIAVAQASTWPSEEEMKHSSWFYWDVDEVQKIWNQSSIYFAYEELQRQVSAIFDVLWAYLNTAGGAVGVNDYIDITLPSNVAETSKKEQAWNTYKYALSLAWSRAHEGDENPHIIPLIELFNGHSERIDETATKGKPTKTTVINVDIASGMWPFIGGGNFVNECNLPCSAIHANRDIGEGEELIISYGHNSPTNFLAKYGVIPEDFLHHHNIMSDVSLWTPPQFIPTESMRVKCLEKSGYPLDILKQARGGTALVHISQEWNIMDAYRQGLCEPEIMKSMRQYLILAQLADDFELHRNYTSGRLRGPLYESRVMSLMCQVVDHNVLQLSPHATDSKDDVRRAFEAGLPAWEKHCLLARVCYRESLLMWRHAFAERGKDARQPEEYSYMVEGPLPSFPHPPPQAASLAGCEVCGRSYPVKKCGRCKQVQYCTKAHQACHWKVHKRVCGK